MQYINSNLLQTSKIIKGPGISFFFSADSFRRVNEVKEFNEGAFKGLRD